MTIVSISFATRAVASWYVDMYEGELRENWETIASFETEIEINNNTLKEHLTWAKW